MIEVGTSKPPIRVAVVNDYPLVVMGLRAILTSTDQVFVVDQIYVNAIPDPGTVDIILYDVFAQAGTIEQFLEKSRSCAAKVVILSQVLQPQAIVDCLRAGVAGYIYKGVSRDQLRNALVAVHAGSTPVVDLKPDQTLVGIGGQWPGKNQGLTQRESEVMALICQGTTNGEIAGRLYLSVNSIKTHIRLAYRKIDVDSRSKAVAWGVEHGFRANQTDS